MASISHTRNRSLKISTAENFLKKPSAPQSPTEKHHGPSHVALFLTNLRLLDLDERKDWPEIDAATFSTKDSQQNIKKRIQSVEWALYHMFCIWDAHDAREKLQPFFPPLEPLQSLNLRAALYRCLDHLKKNGILGRDAVLRKTMLDECKGERLEEVLAVFSNAVLKHVVEQNSNGEEAVAQRMALEKFSYTSVPESLSPLVLAHQFSLSRTLEKKNQARKQYNDFAELLKLKDMQLTTRHEQLKVTIEEDESTEFISKAEVYSLQERARKNWYGNSEWLESIVHGDERFEDDEVLSRSFENVWRKVESGRLDEIEGSRRTGLLEQLDARVKEHKSRLEKWQSFGEQMKSERRKSKKMLSETKKAPSDLVLRFDGHESLSLRTDSKQQKLWKPLSVNADLLETLQRDLANVGKAKRVANPSKLVGRYDHSMSPISQPRLSERADTTMEDAAWESEVNEDAEVGESADTEQTDARSVDLRSPSPGEDTPDHAAASVSVEHQCAQEDRMDLSYEEEPVKAASTSEDGSWKEVEAEQVCDLEGIPQIETPPRHPSPPAQDPVRSPEHFTRPDSPPSPVVVPALAPQNIMAPPPRPPLRTRSSARSANISISESNEHQPASPQEDAATAILNSMAAASPSPVKQRHVLSLAERTRMSISRVSLGRNSLLHLEEFDDLPDMPTPSSVTPTPKIRLSSVLDTDDEDDEAAKQAAAKAEEARRSEALLERTRASMANLELVSKQAQLDRRRSVKVAAKKKRESFMPKPMPVEEELTQNLDRLRLVEDDTVDYEDVFRSRPKIKSSPGVSPARAWRAMGSMGREESESPL